MADGPDIDHPFAIDRHGRTARTGGDEHVRDMIFQFLFTQPQERVNRPEFGAGLLGALFEPNSDDRVSVLEARVQAGLLRWLGDLIDVPQVDVRAHEASLRVVVKYVVRRTGEPGVAEFDGSGT
jgi:phage baseplate assembly protein W